MSEPYRALVSGASGFIGRALCARLQRAGHHVTALMRHASDGPWDSVSLVDLGSSRAEDIDPGPIDVVFHLASRVHQVEEIDDDHDAFKRLNVRGTTQLLDAALRSGAQRFVYFSSVKALGEGGETTFDDLTIPNPSTVYGKSKLAAERLVLDWGHHNARHVSVLRLPLVYGPGVKGNLRAMLNAVRNHRFPPFPETGNRRSLVHRDDVVTASILAAEQDDANGKIYLVTDGETYSTRAMFELMCRACGRSTPRWSIPRSVLSVIAFGGDCIETLLSRRAPLDSDRLDKLLGSAHYCSQRIEDELGFEPRHRLGDALPAMVRELDRGRSALEGGSP